MLTRTLISVLMLGLAGSVAAQMYSWRDADGRMHFSDQPPPNVEAKPTRQGAAGPKYIAPEVATSQPKAAPGAQSAPQAAQSGAPAAPAATQSGPKTLAERDLEYRQRKAAEQEAEAKRKKEAAAAEEKKRYCEGLRNNLSQYEAGGRFSKTDANGERSYVTEEQIRQEAERARGQISRDCK